MFPAVSAHLRELGLKDAGGKLREGRGKAFNFVFLKIFQNQISKFKVQDRKLQTVFLISDSEAVF